MTALGEARWASRALALLALATGGRDRGDRASAAPAIRVQQAVTLGALALGMPHGAADTELLRAAAAGSRTRHVALTVAYAAVAAGATIGIRRGGPRLGRVVLAGSAIHFAEGELATWKSASPDRAVRAAAAAFATVLLPAAVSSVNRRHGGEPRPGLHLLSQDPRPTLLTTTAISAALSAALLARGDHEAGLDTALLTALALVPPPAVAFAAYFGGWHSLRHTARVIDSLVARGSLEPQTGLVAGTAQLARRSAWAAVVGIVAATALVAVDPGHASDNAFAAVLGLTVPHMTTVAIALAHPSAGGGAPR